MHRLKLILLTILACSLGAVSQDYTPLRFQMTEESPANTFIGTIRSAPNLQNLNPEELTQMVFKFFTRANQDDSYFELDTSSGDIRTSGKKLNREEVCRANQDSCVVEIDVGIEEPVEHFAVYSAVIEVLDTNDEAPLFRQNQIELEISESSPVGTSTLLPLAFDSDSPKFAVTRYDIEPPMPDLFELESTDSSLKLKLKSKLDRERVESYNFNIRASDAGNASMYSTLSVRLLIEDANEFSPKFEQIEYMVRIGENFPIGDEIIQVKATDNDTGEYGQLRYAFSPRTESIYGETFEVREESGMVVLKKALDYESATSYSLDVLARDSGVDSQTAQTTVQITILDVNDNAPQITINNLGESTEAGVAEDAPIDTLVAHFSIFDADSGANGATLCTLDSNSFSILPLANNRQKLVTSVLLDREVTPEYVLTIKCSDKGTPPMSNEKEMKVIVKDVNDHAPVFSSTTYVASVTENSPIGSFILQVNATDRDIGNNAKIVYGKSTGAISRFISIDETTGIIRTAARLDYESVKQLEFGVVAKDSGVPVRSTVAMVTLNILDENDNAPEFTQSRFNFEVEENVPSGTKVDTLTAIDPDSAPYKRFTYELQDGPHAQFYILNPQTGELSTRGQIDRESYPSHHLTVHAVDELDRSLKSIAFVDIIVTDQNDNYPHINYPTGDNNTVRISTGVPIGYTILKVQASDPDLSENGELSFMISQNEKSDNAFAINPQSGILETNKLFSDVLDLKEYNLLILVRDEGTPPKTSSTQLTIIVDNTITYAVAQQDTEVNKQTNLTIIIAVASVSGVIMVALIIAIVVLKCSDRKKDRRAESKYMVEVDALHEKEPGKKEVHFVIDTEPAEERHKQVAPMSYEAAANPSSNLSFETRPTNPQQEAHYLGMTENHADNASSSSAELSTADSGRGASERDSHSPPPVIPPRGAAIAANRAPTRPPRRNADPAQQVKVPSHQQQQLPPNQNPPSYKTYLRGSGRHSNPKIPCKVHHSNQQQQPARPQSAMSFGDRPRNGYYGQQDNGSLKKDNQQQQQQQRLPQIKQHQLQRPTSSFEPDTLQIVQERSDSAFSNKGVIV